MIFKISFLIFEFLSPVVEKKPLGMKFSWDDEYLAKKDQIPCPKINPNNTIIPLIHCCIHVNLFIVFHMLI